VTVDLTPLGEHFIGLWCFRTFGEPRTYAVTLNVRGDYYDTTPQATMQAAVDEAARVLQEATA